MKHILTFDIEDWFHIIDIPGLEDVSTWDKRPSIVEDRTNLILTILEEFEVKATFFILGWIAEKYPTLSRKIAESGHEVASHSYWHRRVYNQSRKEFYQDLKRSIDVIQNQTGIKVKGFRAPSFSIVPGTEWAFDIIKEIGLEYDASLFPAKRAHGGYPCAAGIHMLETSKGSLPELPMSISTFGSMGFPFSGGGYLRLLPLWVIKNRFKTFERQGLPVVVYLHPRDFAPDQPRVRMPIHRMFKSYVGLTTTESKLKSLLADFQFTTCEDALSSYLETMIEKKKN
ncbi:MAG: polysaccharide deacetylase family protein [Pseudohongiella sp.]|nr:polysaccharide deacetylase family protein [Pseudohongiella sp.]